jgi:tetratricopeptide (TPR) repeat protein
MEISEYDEKLERAIAAFDNHEYDTARSLFFELGLEFPKEYLPFYYLGLIYKDEDDESFLAYFANAIELCKATPGKDLTLKIHCGDMLYDSGLYNDAITYYNLAYKEKMDDFYVLFRLGKCYYLQEKYPWALKFFLLAYDVQPENMVINYYIGKSYIKNKQEDKALPYLEAAYALDPHNTSICELLLQFYMTKLDLEKCNEYIGHLLTLDNRNGPALFSRAQLHFLIEEYEIGFQILQSIPVEAYTRIKEIRYYFWEGLFLSVLGDSGAAESFETAVSRGKEMIKEGSAEPRDYLYYGCAAAESEEHVTEAIKEIQGVMRKDRYNRGYYSLANARLTEFTRSPDAALGFYTEALKVYQKTEERLLLCLCYYYIEKIYNTKKQEVLSGPAE